MKKQVKLMAVAVTMLVGAMANAQITSTTDTDLNKKTGAAAANGAVIRLIDNKGTIKYLQSRNGLTQITSENTGNETVTTWQLGGTLDAHTYIVADANNATVTDRKVFALDGIKLVQPGVTTLNAVGISSTNPTDTYTAATATTATDGSSHGAVATTGANIGLTAPTTSQNGFTVLIRNEVTGAIEKMLLADLLQVISVQTYRQVAATTAGTTDISVADLRATTGGVGISLGFVTTHDKVSVYRNGVKLRAGATLPTTATALSADYTLRTVGTGTSAVSHIVLADKSAGTLEPRDWNLRLNDIIEVHAIK